MEKDYRPSKIYSKEQMDTYNVPYAYRDYCIDDYMNFLVCQRQSSKLFENGIVYQLPFSSSFTNCGVLKSEWKKCQEYREREIFEEMRQLYLKNLKMNQLEQSVEN